MQFMYVFVFLSDQEILGLSGSQKIIRWNRESPGQSGRLNMSVSMDMEAPSQCFL